MITHEIHKQHIDKKFLFSLRLFILIFFITLGITIFDVIKFQTQWRIPLVWIIIWAIVWTAMLYAQKVSRDADKLKVITKIDRTGMIIVGCYILFAFWRRRLFWHLIQGNGLVVLTLAFTAGTMISRLLVLSHGIKKLIISLYEDGKLKKD